jgi:hypothetical protein
MTQSTNIITAPHSDRLVSRRVVDVFIGGLFDKTSRIVAAYCKRFHRSYPHHTIFYFEYDQHQEIIVTVKAVKAGGAAGVVNLIGHSWGAVTAIKAANELARNGINADHLITIDPVSRKRIGLTTSVIKWTNVSATPATSNGWDGDYWAILGGKWHDWPRGKATVHYWAPCHHNEFASLLEYVSLDAHCALDCLISAARP